MEGSVSDGSETGLRSRKQCSDGFDQCLSENRASLEFCDSDRMKGEKSRRSGKFGLCPLVAAPKSLPFEFRALESCLESACGCLESETRTLEEEAYPALDELTSKISSLNLERVRQIKSRLVAISGRVQKVRDEIEHLLDDDSDMAEMYLTEKLIAARNLDQTFPKEDTYNATLGEDNESVEESRSEDGFGSVIDFKPNIEELEMLLEAYFAQLDGILQKLSDMSEYVDDTEDCINIILDDKQNLLLQMGVVLNTMNMIINAGIVIVGLFGMNIHISLFDGKPIQFWESGRLHCFVSSCYWVGQEKIPILDLSRF